MAQSQGQEGSRNFTQRLVDGFESFWKGPEEFKEPQRNQQQNNQNQQPPQNQQQQNHQNYMQQHPELDDNGNPKQQQQDGGRKADDPLATYSGLWDNSPKLDKDGKPLVSEPPKFKLDPKTISEAASKINFTDGLPPEITEKMNTGQQLTGQEQQAVLQHSSQRAYEVAMQHASTLVDRFVDMRLNHEQQGLPALMNRHLAKSKALSHDAVRNNPQLAAHFEEVSTRIAAKYPDKDPDWVAEQTEAYFVGVAKAMGMKTSEEVTQSQQQQQPHTNERGETRRSDGKIFDYEAYLKL